MVGIVFNAAKAKSAVALCSKYFARSSNAEREALGSPMVARVMKFRSLATKVHEIEKQRTERDSADRGVEQVPAAA